MAVVWMLESGEIWQTPPDFSIQKEVLGNFDVESTRVHQSLVDSMESAGVCQSTSVKRNSGFPHFASLFISFPYFYLLFFEILLLALGRQASTSKMTTKGTIKGILQTLKQVQSRIIIE